MNRIPSPRKVRRGFRCGTGLVQSLGWFGVAGLVVSMNPTQAREIHVAPASNAALAPAFAQAHPGDTVLLGRGTYALDDSLRLALHGQPEAWITVRAETPGAAVFDASAWHPRGLKGLGETGALHVEGSEYLRLEGVRVINSPGAGILVHGPSHHIAIVGCSSDLSFAPGIGAWNMEHLQVLDCEVTQANDPRQRRFGDPQQECPHEAISIAGVKYFEVARNHVHDSIKEGIDVKEVSGHGVVHHNTVHDLHRQGLYVDAWFGLLEDVEFHSNTVRGCEWGLGISVEGEGSELRNVRIHHNLFVANRGSGIFFGTWGTNGPRSHIRIFNNTIVDNGHRHHWAGPTGSIDIRSASARDVIVAHNICVGGGAYEIATSIDPAATPGLFRERGIRIVENLCGANARATASAAFPDTPYGSIYATLGDRPVIAEPHFTDPWHGAFNLQPDSPAILSDMTNPPDDFGEGYVAGYLGAFPPGSGPSLGGPALEP